MAVVLDLVAVNQQLVLLLMVVSAALLLVVCLTWTAAMALMELVMTSEKWVSVALGVVLSGVLVVLLAQLKVPGLKPAFPRQFMERVVVVLVALILQLVLQVELAQTGLLWFGSSYNEALYNQYRNQSLREYRFGQFN
jgi:hypothetical protein